MKVAVENTNSMQNSPDYWMNEELNAKNIINFVKFLAEEYPEHKEVFLDIRKKILRGNKAVVSILITFLREVDKSNENLIKFCKKLIQCLMDNPKGFKR